MGQLARALPLALIFILLSCTSTRTSPEESGSAPPTPSVELTDAWSLVSREVGCEGEGFESPDLPVGVTVWAPINECRVLVAGQFGLSVIKSGEALTLTEDLGGVSSLAGLAEVDGRVWVSGESSGTPSEAVVGYFDDSGFHPAQLPYEPAFVLGPSPYRDGVLVAAGSKTGRMELLRATERQVTRRGRLPRNLGLLALSPTSFTGTTSGQRVDRVFGGLLPDAPKASPAAGPALSPNAGSGDSTIRGRTMAVGVNLLDAGGVANAVELHLSRDTGQTWRRTPIPGTIELGSMAADDSGALYAFVGTRSGDTRILRSADGQRWSRLPGAELGDSSVDLAVIDDALWILTDRLLRIDVS